MAGKLDDLTFEALLAVLQSGMWLRNDLEVFLKPHGLSHSRFSILISLQQSGEAECIAADLSAGFGISKPTISRLTKKLIAGGYVVEKASTEDRRKKRLVLTSKGERILGAIVPEYNRRLALISSQLNDSDKGDMIRTLAKLNLPAATDGFA